jgi:hypothetical protein
MLSIHKALPGFHLHHQKERRKLGEMYKKIRQRLNIVNIQRALRISMKNELGGRGKSTVSSRSVWATHISRDPVSLISPSPHTQY